MSKRKRSYSGCTRSSHTLNSAMCCLRGFGFPREAMGWTDCDLRAGQKCLVLRYLAAWCPCQRNFYFPWRLHRKSVREPELKHPHLPPTSTTQHPSLLSVFYDKEAQAMAHRENWNSQMAWAPSHSKKRQNQAGPDSVTIRVAKAVQALKVQEKYYKSFF